MNTVTTTMKALLSRAKWSPAGLIPAVAALLMPKCPLCLAAYFGVFSGTVAALLKAPGALALLGVTAVGLTGCIAKKVRAARAARTIANTAATSRYGELPPCCTAHLHRRRA